MQNIDLDLFYDLSSQELYDVSGGVNWIDLGVAALGVGGMFASAPVGIGIGLFCGAYSITRAICS